MAGVPANALLLEFLLPEAAGGTHLGLLLSAEGLHIIAGFLVASEGRPTAWGKDGDPDLMAAGAGSTEVTDASHLGFDFLSFFSPAGFFCTVFFFDSLLLLTPKSSSLSLLSSKSGSLSEPSPVALSDSVSLALLPSLPSEGALLRGALA